MSEPSDEAEAEPEAVSSRFWSSVLEKLSRLPWRSSWELLVPLGCAYAWFWCLREVSPKDPLWADELLTRILSTDRSPLNMLDAVADGVDGSPPAYWLSMWAWVKLAGATPFALRLPTTIWVVVATFVSWATFRRRYGFCSASVATTTLYLSTPVVWNHAFEARHYGMLVAGAATACLVADRLFELDKPSRRWWIANGAANAVLVNTHLFGFFYSGCTLLGLALADLRRRRFRWRLYLSYVAGWATFIPWIPSMLRQRKSTEWGYWVGKPNLEAITKFDAFLQGIPMTRVLVYVFAFLGLGLLLGRARTEDRDECTPVPLAGFFFVFLIPVVAWWLSVHGPTSVWVDRYMAPQFLGWAAFVALALHRLGLDGPAEGARAIRVLRSVTLPVAAVGLVWYLGQEAMTNARGKAQRGIGPLDTSGLPIASEMSHRVLEQWYYAPQVEIYYVLDVEAAKRLGDGTAIDYKIMSALGRHYPVKILTTAEFLERFPSFLHLETGSTWFTRGLGSRYKVSGYRPGFSRVTRIEPVRQ